MWPIYLNEYEWGEMIYAFAEYCPRSQAGSGSSVASWLISSIICFVVEKNLLHVPHQSQLILTKLSLSNEGIYRSAEHLHKYTYDDEFINRQLPNLSVWETEMGAYRHKKTYTLVQK